MIAKEAAYIINSNSGLTKFIQLVTITLQLQQQKQSATLPEQLQQLEQRIAYTDSTINEKVYALYGLSKEEVGVVEGAAGKR
jgi:hypothetical protein